MPLAGSFTTTTTTCSQCSSSVSQLVRANNSKREEDKNTGFPVSPRGSSMVRSALDIKGKSQERKDHCVTMNNISFLRWKLPANGIGNRILLDMESKHFGMQFRKDMWCTRCQSTYRQGAARSELRDQTNHTVVLLVPTEKIFPIKEEKKNVEKMRRGECTRLRTRTPDVSHVIDRSRAYDLGRLLPIEKGLVPGLSPIPLPGRVPSLTGGRSFPLYLSSSSQRIYPSVSSSIGRADDCLNFVPIPKWSLTPEFRML
ncbi:hypothetical protein M0804_010386 [Polistes exclamans]|nr:hypothetical protein M0804_010386 [Polistes exclamans]